jgi:predicted metalloprotease with PDZ domain
VISRGRALPLGLASVLALGASGCVRGAPGHAAQGLPEVDYVLGVPPSGSWRLEVEATYERLAGDWLVAPEAGEALHLEAAPAAVAARSGSAWAAPPACRVRCTLRYSVDLDALAGACHGHDCTRRVGDAMLGLASAWMLRPAGEGDAVLRVRLRGGDPDRFATGLRVDPRSGGYVFHASELGEASYTAFGAMRRRRLAVAGSTLDVVSLGAPLEMGDAAVTRWIESAGVSVAPLFGRFPVDATVFVVPVAGTDGIVFGRVMSLAGASLVLFFGDQTRLDEAPQDWVVVHELFHLGCPSMLGEGHWLEEGLATYYEPILRERAGWMTEADLWAHFVREMPRGLRLEGEPAPIEERDDIDSTYWGGALFALLADVSLRETSAGSRSLDDVMRRELAVEGDATHGCRVGDFLRTAGAHPGDGALEDVYERWALRGQNADLPDLWRRLGVEPRPDGTVALQDDAPLAGVRRGIAGAGPGH